MCIEHIPSDGYFFTLCSRIEIHKRIGMFDIYCFILPLFLYFHMSPGSGNSNSNIEIVYAFCHRILFELLHLPTGDDHIG